MCGATYFVHSFCININECRQTPNSRSVDHMSTFVSIPSVFEQFSQIITRVRRGFQITTAHGIFAFGCIQLFTTIPRTMITDITIETRITFYAFIRVFVIITIYFSSAIINRVAISVRAYVFIFVDLFLQRTLTGMTILGRRQDVTRPARIFITSGKPNPFLLNRIHVVKHLP